MALCVKLKAAGCHFRKVPFLIPSFLLPVLGADQQSEFNPSGRGDVKTTAHTQRDG